MNTNDKLSSVTLNPITIMQIREWLNNPEIVVQMPYVPPPKVVKIIQTTLSSTINPTTPAVSSRPGATNKPASAIGSRPTTVISRPGSQPAQSRDNSPLKNRPGTTEEAGSRGSSPNKSRPNTSIPEVVDEPPVPKTIPVTMKLFDYLFNCGCVETMKKLREL